MGRLQDKIAIVTGAARGIGKAIALRFVQEGATVILADIDPDAAQATASEIDPTGSQTKVAALDVADADAVSATVQNAVSNTGPIDILVNNAGMSPLYDKITDVTEALYDKVLDVNLKGPFRLSALVGTRMVEDGGGSIINVSSIASTHTTPDVIPYGAAKAGLNAMTQGYARAFGPTVRVNCIVCGAFLTDISKAWDLEAVWKRAKENFALQRPGNPEEIIGTALYFASDASSYTTGALIDVDGGR